MKTRIISAFPACGKSYIFQNQEELNITCSDSDSSHFSWVKDSKGNNTTIRNPDFPQNYIEHIKSLLGDVDYIFVSSHLEVRNALDDNELTYSLVLPSKELKHEWLGRCWIRGNKDSFLNLINDNWDNWVNPAFSFCCISQVRLGSGEFLKDKLYFLETTISSN
ncbi:hypothetical protein NVP1101O_125 [Vibrio phage 1.101.O._10N.261.45.C6]|nr:hypothetical protein NVP1101O_125 [Vibrio phage 1.101.O._10N.261.45.C6]